MKNIKNPKLGPERVNHLWLRTSNLGKKKYDVFFGLIIYGMWGKKIMSLGPLVKELAQGRPISAYAHCMEMYIIVFLHINIYM